MQTASVLCMSPPLLPASPDVVCSIISIEERVRVPTAQDIVGRQRRYSKHCRPIVRLGIDIFRWDYSLDQLDHA